jgi:energy-converting hydrogenase Eha subunit G
MGILLASILLLSLAKIPFTSTYYPGTSRFGVAWPLYLTGFITYSFAPARMQLALQRSPSTTALIVFSVMTIGVALALGLWRNYKLRAQVGLTFEEEDPSSMFQGFSLSEGMAAAPESRLH